MPGIALHTSIMGNKYSTGELVWVPGEKLGGNQPFALVQRNVRGQEQRSVLIDGPDASSIKVSSRLVHRNTLGFLVLRVGDMATEASLLDPLAKSVLQYLRLLVQDDVVHAVSIRTREELTEYMQELGSGVSHVVVIGHGKSDALIMLRGRPLTAPDFLSAMGRGDTERTLISLACKTGRQAFSGVVSSSEGWREVVAPHDDVHGAGASLFLQFLLHTHLVHGHEFKTSARLADAATEGIRFRHWRNGRLVSSKGRTRLLTKDTHEGDNGNS